MARSRRSSFSRPPRSPTSRRSTSTRRSSRFPRDTRKRSAAERFAWTKKSHSVSEWLFSFPDLSHGDLEHSHPLRLVDAESGKQRIELLCAQVLRRDFAEHSAEVRRQCQVPALVELLRR